jgi:hypothetical protein
MQHLRASFRGLFARVDWGLRIAWYIDERMGHLLFLGFRNCIGYSGLLRVFRDSVLCLESWYSTWIFNRSPAVLLSACRISEGKKKSPNLSR